VGLSWCLITVPTNTKLPRPPHQRVSVSQTDYVVVCSSTATSTSPPSTIGERLRYHRNAAHHDAAVGRLRTSRLISRTISISSGIGCRQGAAFLRRCGGSIFRTSRAGSTTTVTSIRSNCSRPCTGLMRTSFAGLVASTSACASRRKGRESGWLGFVVPVQISSLTGVYVMAAAEHREPCESRGSRTFLGARGNAIPPRDSTLLGQSTRSTLYVSEKHFICLAGELPPPSGRNLFEIIVTYLGRTPS
jgi:hypothetical protein